MKRPSSTFIRLPPQAGKQFRLQRDGVGDSRRAKGTDRWRALAPGQFRALIELSPTQERPKGGS